MARLKISIVFSLAFVTILFVGFLGIQGWQVEAAHLNLWMKQDESNPASMMNESYTPTPTPTPVIGMDPPDFPSCPAGFELLGTYDDYIRRDIEPRSQSYPFTLSEDGIVRLEGWVMEGHPDLGCPGHPDCDVIQDHEDIIFEIDEAGLGIYEDSEHGPFENAWYFYGPMFADLAEGSHILTFRHTLEGDDAQSVGYRFSLCRLMEASPCPTDTPDLTPTSTPTFSSSPTQLPSSTPTPWIAPTELPSSTPTPWIVPTDQPSSTPTFGITPTNMPTNTPAPRSGVVVFGSVQLADAPDRSVSGLAGAEIYMAFASYQGRVVAVTGKDGSYKSGFISIPVDETIRVWAEKAGHRFEPVEEVWRFYAGYLQEREIDFMAYPDAVTVTPITPTCTPGPTATPEPIVSSCRLTAKPRTPNGYVLFEELGEIYPTDGIFNIQAGTVSTWACLEPYYGRDDHVILHTSDSRVVLYVDTYFSQAMQETILRFVGRAGGTHRAVDSDFAPGNFPEASIIVDNDGSLNTYDHEWYSPVPFREGEWHLVTMTWEGYPRGTVKIFLDGNLIGQKPYDERYNDERPLADSLAIGFRPAEWIGEVYLPGNQEVYGGSPGMMRMSLWEGGIQIFDLRLYQRPLSQQEILSIFSELYPNP